MRFLNCQFLADNFQKISTHTRYSLVSMMMAEGKSGQKRAAKQNIVELHFLITDSENCALYTMQCLSKNNEVSKYTNSVKICTKIRIIIH